MKILILGLIFGSISFLGFKIGNVFKEKEVFYYDFKNFLIYLKSEIGFFRRDIVEIIEAYQTKNKNITMLLGNFKQSLNGENFQKINILSDSENAKIEEFFKGVGVSDCDSQKEYIEKNIEIFSKSYEDAKQQNLKQGIMYKKLSILVGILVCIILI